MPLQSQSQSHQLLAFSSAHQLQLQQQSQRPAPTAGLHVDIQLANDEATGAESAPLSSALSSMSSGRESIASSADTCLRMSSGVRSEERLSSGADTEAEQEADAEAEGSRTSRCSAYSACPSVDSAVDLVGARGAGAVPLCPELLLPAAELLYAPQVDLEVDVYDESGADGCVEFDSGTLTRESKRKQQQHRRESAATPGASEYSMCSIASEPELAQKHFEDSEDQYATVVRTHRRNLTADESILLLPARDSFPVALPVPVPDGSCEQKAAEAAQSAQHPSREEENDEPRRTAREQEMPSAALDSKPHSDRSRSLACRPQTGRSLSAPGHRLLNAALCSGDVSLSTPEPKASCRPLASTSCTSRKHVYSHMYYSWPRTPPASIPLPRERRSPRRRFPPPLLLTSPEPTGATAELSSAACVSGALIGEDLTPQEPEAAGAEKPQRLSALLTMHSSFCSDLWASTERNRVYWPVSVQQEAGAGAWTASVRAMATNQQRSRERTLPVPVPMPHLRATLLDSEWQAPLFISRARPQLSLPGPYLIQQAHTLPLPASPGNHK